MGKGRKKKRGWEKREEGVGEKRRVMGRGEEGIDKRDR
jgi:hypothetical protein